MILVKEFYNEIADETKAVVFLQRDSLLDVEEEFVSCHRCGEENLDDHFFAFLVDLCSIYR